MTKHRSPDERVDQILTAARNCFLKHGYFATKMDAIAKESGLSKGGVYFHFTSKREIFKALVEQEYEAAMEFIDRTMESESNMIMILSELAEHFVQLFASSDRPRFMVIIGEMALRDKEIATLLRKLQMSYFETISTLLERGIADGQIKSIDVHSTAVILKSLLDGIQANFAVGLDFDLEKVITAGIELLMHGIVNFDENITG